jgi:hypothetical protein
MEALPQRPAVHKSEALLLAIGWLGEATDCQDQLDEGHGRSAPSESSIERNAQEPALFHNASTEASSRLLPRANSTIGAAGLLARNAGSLEAKVLVFMFPLPETRPIGGGTREQSVHSGRHRKERETMPRHVGSRLGAALLLAVTIVCPSKASRAQDSAASDWPCPQVLVRKISLPAIWSGPAIDGVDWRNDPARVETIARLAARRTPVEDAQKSIDGIAATAGAHKEAELLALFAGLFETLDAERIQVIDGLVRFGRKQKELAETIKTDQTALRAKAAPDDKASDALSAATRMQWNLRVFEERRQALASVCESPALIEQRLFALARTIQQNLD